MKNHQVIGLIPCGGHATRISPLPCSKEVLPVGLREMTDGSTRPKVVSHYLLEKMSNAGIDKAFFILRKGKWDIPEYYGDGSAFGIALGYLIMGRPHGPAFTLDQAYPFVRHARVAAGFPDILFEPLDAFRRALERLESTRADIVLGLYRAHDIRIWDMVEVDRSGRVRELLIKPDESKSKLGWVFAVWTPKFTEFMHEYLATPSLATRTSSDNSSTEVTVGEVIQAAVGNGLPTQSVQFPRHDYLDIGTPDGLQRVAGYCFQPKNSRGHSTFSAREEQRS